MPDDLGQDPYFEEDEPSIIDRVSDFSFASQNRQDPHLYVVIERDNGGDITDTWITMTPPAVIIDGDGEVSIAGPFKMSDILRKG